MSYALFRRLCDTLVVRNGPADRDRALYDQLRENLRMNGMGPKPFFASHPEVTEAAVLVAFLEALEPFSRMLEEIFRTCSHSPRGGTGGNDLTLRYSDEARSLRFDLDAFLRFRHLRRLVSAPRVIPRYHSDFVPLFGAALERLTRGEGNRWLPHDPSIKPPPGPPEFDAFFARAKETGTAHLNLLDELLAEGDPGDLPRWLGERGVTGDILPGSIGETGRWRASIEAGLRALDQLDGRTVVDTVPHDQLRPTLTWLCGLLRRIRTVRNGRAWRDAIERFLQFPYWKKRWQVYEVWVVASWLDALFAAGGRANPGADGQVRLRTGSKSEPLGILDISPSLAVELWMEFPISSHDQDLRPDMVIAIRHGESRVPLRFVECKQRMNVTADAMWGDARKYLPSMPRGSEHVVLNYDSYPDGASSVETDAEQRTLISMGGVRPDGTGEGWFRRLISETFGGDDAWVLVVDTTGSMHGLLPMIANHIRDIPVSARGARMLLVLYGDHGDTYTVKLHAETADAASLSAALLQAPTTHGDDAPEALEDALNFVRVELQRRGWPATRVVVFSDAPAHAPSECPHGYDFEDELRRLIDRGCDVTLVDCGEPPGSIGWDRVADAAEVVALRDHRWPAARSPVDAPGRPA